MKPNTKIHLPLSRLRALLTSMVLLGASLPALAETFTFNASIDSDFLYSPNWSGGAGGTATPGNMGVADTYVVAQNATLFGPASASGTISVSPGTTLTVNGAGSLTLNPSAHLDVATGGTLVNDGATVTLHASGLTRITDALPADPNTYAAIDADDAAITGEVVFDFDFTSPAGTHTFDLIVTGSATALDDSTAMSLDVVDLPTGFVVLSYGVIEDGGVDKLRLVIGSESALAVAPLLHWSLEEESGTTTAEAISGATDIATLINSPTRVAGLAPFSMRALDFQITAPGSYVDAGTLQTDGQYATKASAIDSKVLTGEWTMAAWIEMPEGTFGGDRCILTSDNDLSNAWLFFIAQTTGKRNNLGFDFGSERIRSGLDVPTGRPVFVAISVDPAASAFGTGNKYRFAMWDGLNWSYVEGTSSYSPRLKGLEIGSWNSGERQFKGAIDEVRIYDKALSKGDLAGLALQNTTGTDFAGMVGVPGEYANTFSVDFTVQFTQPVTGFDTSDLVFTGVPSNSVYWGTPVITGSGSTYQISLPVQGEGSLLLDLQTGSGIQNLSGDPLVQQVGGSIIIDQTSPQVVSITPDTTGPVTTGTKTAFTIVFSEPIQNFYTSDLDFTGSGPGTVYFEDPSTSDGVTYTCYGQLNVPDGETGGLLHTTILLGTAITDLAGNPLIGPVPTSADVTYSATDYQLWAISKGLTPNVDFDYDLDADSDGRLNGEEFLREGDPLVAGDPVKQRIHLVDQPGGRYAVLTIVAPDANIYLSETPGTITAEYSDFSLSMLDVIESSPNLVDWGTAPGIVEDPSVATPLGMPALSPGWSYRHFRFTDPVSTLPKAFIRNRAANED